jgi:hypothetical protein
MNRFKELMLRQQDGYVLGLFRIFYGLLMTYEMADYISINLVDQAFILPLVKLTYFDFIQALPAPVMKAMLFIMLIASVCITLGVWFRYSAAILSVFYLYFFLLDKALYNNHLYLFVMLAFLLSFTHADRFFSVKQLFGKKEPVSYTVAYWEVFIFQLIFAVVYFYGGLAKINHEWIFRQEPMTSMITNFPESHPLAFIYRNEFQIPFLTYGGLLFDLFIAFFLFYKPTRKWALIPVFIFHVSNNYVFNDIGIFPLAMILSTVLYFPTEELPFLRNKLKHNTQSKKHVSKELHSPDWVFKVLIVFFAFQFLFPFRGYFLPNDVDWTSIAQRFSWRMKIQTRPVEAFNFTIQDGEEGIPQEVDMSTFINPMQRLKITIDPRAAVQAARALADEGRRRGMNDPIVKADIRVRWNGREPHPIVDPEVNLAGAEIHSFQKNDWIAPKPD